jgi:predicted methyltransferase
LAEDYSEALAAGGTMFHLVNTYTKASQMNGLSAEISYRLQKVGGEVLGMLN